MTSLFDKACLKDYQKSLSIRLRNLKEAHNSTQTNRAPVTLDQTTQGRLSRIDSMQVQAMAIETDRRRKIEISQIESICLYNSP